MRESFVFHAEYIIDLPEKYRAAFIAHTVGYGLYGKNPPIEEGTLEYALWAKIARRIDAESEKYASTCERRRTTAQERPPETESDGKGAPRFEKPTAEEVAAYCAERKNGLDARAFFDFYESKGWKVGNQRMKDWRACVRTWERRRKTEQTGGRNKAGAMWGGENEVSQDIVDMI